jgi:hypothetical protein
MFKSSIIVVHLIQWLMSVKTMQAYPPAPPPNDIASHIVTAFMRTREHSIGKLPELHSCEVTNIYEYMSVTEASRANKVTERISGISFIPNWTNLIEVSPFWKSASRSGTQRFLKPEGSASCL